MRTSSFQTKEKWDGVTEHKLWLEQSHHYDESSLKQQLLLLFGLFGHTVHTFKNKDFLFPNKREMGWCYRTEVVVRIESPL
jgi:hypothetical protein